MVEALLPMLGYLVIQLFVSVIGMNLFSKGESMGPSNLLKVWVFGQMLLFAVFEIITVPLILLRWSFNALFWIYLATSVVLFFTGLKRARNAVWMPVRDLQAAVKQLKPMTIILFIIAVILIFSQFAAYFVGVRLDNDDARWLAEANDALEYGDLMTRNYSTGEYKGSYAIAKDVASPWPLIFAILSRLLWGTRVPVVAHTLYASVEVFAMYAVYWLIARELFQKRDARLVFLIAVAVINLFYGAHRHTQSVFALHRVWQGKATVAAVIMPLLIYLSICLNKRDNTSDWIKLLTVDGAACLMSGMGTAMAAIVIGVYGLYHILIYKKWKRIPVWILCVVPSALFSLIYFYYKG